MRLGTGTETQQKGETHLIKIKLNKTTFSEMNHPRQYKKLLSPRVFPMLWLLKLPGKKELVTAQIHLVIDPVCYILSNV